MESTLANVTISWDDRDRPLIAVHYKDSDEARETASPEGWLRALADRLSEKSARYLWMLVKLNEKWDVGISFDQLAGLLSVEKGDVDAWNRNLGRPIKAVVRDHGLLRPYQDNGTAQLFDIAWEDDEHGWRYAVPEELRSALIGVLKNNFSAEQLEGA